MSGISRGNCCETCVKFVCRWDCGLECLLYGAGYGVASVDIRGRGGHGRGWRSGGSEEMEDMEQVMQFLMSLKSIDSSKICLYGSGYGGYIVLKSLLANTASLSSIKCGLVHAPITNWRLGT